MRLVQREGKLEAQFTLVWEVSYLADLAEQGDRWVPFTLPGKPDPIGEIHAGTHEVHLFAGHSVIGRQAVTLSLSPSPPEEKRS